MSHKNATLQYGCYRGLWKHTLSCFKAVELSVFKQQLPCIPPSSHFPEDTEDEEEDEASGLQLSYIFHSRVVNPPPMFNVDTALGKKKTKKGKKK